MIQIELPCCDAIVDLEPAAVTVRCEACGLEHLLATDARAEAPGGPSATAVLATAA